MKDTPKSIDIFAGRTSIMGAYVLNEHNEPVALTDAEWFQWIIDHNGAAPQKSVARTDVKGARVVTSFVGTDLNAPLTGERKGAALTFETMIFFDDGRTATPGQYATWAEAERGHREAVLLATETL